MNKKTIITFCLLITLLSIFGVLSISAQTPDALIKELYKTHAEDMTNDGNRILSSQNRNNLDKFFDKSLADMMWKDLTNDAEELGVLDFDPFYNAQDFEIKNLAVGAPKIVGTKATVIVKFSNFGKKETITYQLIKRGAAWKISDIKYAKGGSLVKYFKDAAKSS